MLSETIAFASLAPMLVYVITKRSAIGFLAWLFFSIAAIAKSFEFLQVADYFNTILFILGGVFFLLLALAIFKSNSEIFISVTFFSAISCAIYFPFVFFESLNSWIIETTAFLTSILGRLLGFKIVSAGRILELNNSYVEIILACTAIESISLFAGATLGIKAKLKRKLKAFAISVPTIYFLNLLRNVFVLVSLAYSIFGDDSFYIAHHVISKILATAALIAIAYATFRILPELAELIYSLKGEIVRGVRGD
ncbi:MAG: archaeosortase A [Archaeoglobaceae archaeon]